LKTNNVEKYFVTYNQAIGLKRLGFDDPCISYFDTCCQFRGLSHNLTYQILKNDGVLAPLKSQVFEWARDKYNINICISWRDDLLNYDISLTEMKKGGYFYYKESFNNYEEAESACIDKLIEVIKTQNS